MNPSVGTTPSLVIFDCDGVLVDSERLTVAVEARLLTELGWSVTVDDVVEQLMGRSDASVRKIMAERIGEAKAAEVDRRLVPEVTQAFHDELAPIAGVIDVIDALEHAGVATCIASSGTHQKMELTLGLTGLRDRFESRIYSATEVERGKPAPDLFLHAAASMGHAPSESAVIEDSTPGVRGAVAAGMTCYGFAGGLTKRERLVDAGALPFDTMADLAELLLP